MSTIDYINSLPKKIVASAAIFLNKNGELLIVKPNYRDGWLVPGGGIDAMESPKDGCLREIREEIGLTVTDVQFLSVNHHRNSSDEGVPYDSLEFTFWAGVLSDEQIANIVLQDEELDEFKFCPIEEALALLNPKLSHRIKLGLDALAHDTA